METWLLDHGFPALFLLSFLAATLLPLGSEWLLMAMLLQGFEPSAVVLVATLGNSLGALTTYAVGLWGGPYLFEKVFRISQRERRRAERFYRRYGSWTLLLAWLPVIGDPLCLVGGVLHTGWLRFTVLVTIGKLLRYQVVAMAVQEGSRLLASV